jgi:hypothetical protein
MACGSRGERAQRARREPPHGTATPPYRLRRTAGGLPTAATGRRPAPAPAATFPPAAPPQSGAILPSATILNPGAYLGRMAKSGSWSYNTEATLPPDRDRLRLRPASVVR